MSKIKVSDFVADYLCKVGIGHVFIISGGASIHLLHSIEEHPNVQAICPHHEQGAAMAADGYARATGNLGCAIGTSGPGATNMITGIAGAWFDSVPVLFITGQVTTFRMKGDLGVRQMGFQETDIVPMVKPITKYAYQIKEVREIRARLDEALLIASQGRPGPVLIDIPDDLQRSFIDPAELFDTVPTDGSAEVGTRKLDGSGHGSIEDDLPEVVDMLQSAQRPVMVLGWGVRLSGAVQEARELVERLGIPVLTTWAAKDILPEETDGLVGTFGTHGTRAGNFAMQNSDMVLSIGARLSTRETGSPLDSWAREAKTVIVDIDETELNKFGAFGKRIDRTIQADARAFITALNNAVGNFDRPDLDEWDQRVEAWKQAYPSGPAFDDRPDAVEPYAILNDLTDLLDDETQIFLDTGCSVAWSMQSFRVRKDQRVFHDFNNTAMGWALPAAIGSNLATGHERTLCIAGDGSMMMNIQELATVAKHNLPVKVLLLNNSGYSMVQQTQEQWFDSKYYGTSTEGGLGFPDFVALSQSFGIPAVRVDHRQDAATILKEAIRGDGPCLIDVVIPAEGRVRPQSKFGYPIEDAEPLLPRDEFLKNMLVRPVAKSQEPLSE